MYYFDDGKKFSSKVEAYEYSLKSRKDFRLYYFDEVFSNLNWKIEPPHSLEYYYLEQAKRIRDNYDYVILCYSGGYDSTNILETFYFNNLKIDKIVTVGAFNEDTLNQSDENHNGELYHNVFPYIKDLGLENIAQVCDYSKYFDDINNFSVLKFGNSWIDEVGARYSPHNWFWKDIEKYVVPKEWKEKKVAIIFGKDKPSLMWFNDNSIQRNPTHSAKSGFAFTDGAALNYGNVFTYESCDRINFYWDPGFPQILIKQMHVLKRHYDLSKQYSFNMEMLSQKFGSISTDDLIYNLKRPLIFKSPKSSMNYLSLRDKFLVNKKDAEIYNLYIQGLANMKRRLGIIDLKLIYSKFYAID